MIYFIQRGDDGPVKIGHVRGEHVTGVRFRLNQLQAGSAERLQVRAAMPGEKVEELALHERLSEDRMRGEWFRPSPALLALMRDHAVEPTSFWPGPKTPGGPPPRVAGRSIRLEFTVPAETFDRIEVARGDVPRAAWIKRALESALGRGDAGARVPEVGGPGSPMNAGYSGPAAPYELPKIAPRRTR